MKQELITEQKWISNERFNRVYSVYQVLPGPEATELACYFGYISGGRFGAILGGLGFLLPGFLSHVISLLVICHLWIRFSCCSSILFGYSSCCICDDL